MVYGFITFWVAAALVVFFLAIRGGRPANPARRGDSRLANRGIALLFVALLIAGLAIPTLVLTANGDHKASVAPGGVSLNASDQHGRSLFSQVCSSCHTLAAARGVGKVGPNLDLLIGNINSAKGRLALVLSAVANGRARGMGNMPALLYQGRDAQDVASFVADAAGH